MKAISLITILGVLALCLPTGRAQAQSYPKETEQLSFATQLLAQSEYQFAASSYEDFIKQFPHSQFLANAYVGAGDSHFFLKEPDKALEFYRKYESEFPNGKDKWLVLLREGQCLSLEGNNSDAVSKLKEIDPSAIPASYRQTYYFVLATALMNGGNLKEAGENFEKVIEQNTPGQYTTLAYLRLAAIMSKAGDTKDAQQLYATAMQGGDDSLDQQAQVDLVQGMAYLQAGQYDLAASSFENILDRTPDAPAAKDAAVNWFVALLKNNQADQLLSEYDQRFKNDFSPANGRIHLLAVDALLLQKQNGAAMDILNTLIATPGLDDKVKGEALMQKAKLLADAGQYNDVLSMLDGQTSSDLQTQDSLDLLKGQSYLGLHEYDKAWGIFSKTAAKDPTNASAFCFQAHVRETQGKDEASAALFMDCYNKAKDDAYKQDALFSAFLMYKKANKTGQAMDAGKTYLTQYPQGRHFDEVLFHLSELYSQGKQYDKAVDLLKNLPSSSSYEYQREAAFQIAYNLQLAGKTGEALKLYEVVINQNTDQQLTRMALKNSALIYSQNNDDDKAALALTALVTAFPANDLTDDDYSWLLKYWQQKHDAKRVEQIHTAIQQHHNSSRTSNE